ncbi:MAG TPA: hypothetical protein VIJ22_11040 [Polyangiaceae bacterium]
MRATGWVLAAAATLAVVTSVACNDERKQECDRFLTAMKPLEKGTPTVELVDSVAKQVEALHLQDATLAIYAKNYQATLVVLSNTLKLKAGPSAPDGTDAAVQGNLKVARTDADDAQRYCAP